MSFQVWPGEVGQGGLGPGIVGHAVARFGQVRHGMDSTVRLGVPGSGSARLGMAGRGEGSTEDFDLSRTAKWFGGVLRGRARPGFVRHGSAWRAVAVQGSVRELSQASGAVRDGAVCSGAIRSGRLGHCKAWAQITDFQARLAMPWSGVAGHGPLGLGMGLPRNGPFPACCGSPGFGMPRNGTLRRGDAWAQSTGFRRDLLRLGSAGSGPVGRDVAGYGVAGRGLDPGCGRAGRGLAEPGLACTGEEATNPHGVAVRAAQS